LRIRKCNLSQPSLQAVSVSFFLFLNCLLFIRLIQLLVVRLHHGDHDRRTGVRIRCVFFTSPFHCLTFDNRNAASGCQPLRLSPSSASQSVLSQYPKSGIHVSREATQPFERIKFKWPFVLFSLGRLSVESSSSMSISFIHRSYCMPIINSDRITSQAAAAKQCAIGTSETDLDLPCHVAEKGLEVQFGVANVEET